MARNITAVIRSHKTSSQCPNGRVRLMANFRPSPNAIIEETAASKNKQTDTAKKRDGLQKSSHIISDRNNFAKKYTSQLLEIDPIDGKSRSKHFRRGSLFRQAYRWCIFCQKSVYFPYISRKSSPTDQRSAGAVSAQPSIRNLYGPLA